MRALLLELRPSELAGVGLHDAIAQLIDALRSRRDIEVSAALESVELDPDTHLAFYRISQEALSNIAQHSQASAVDVRLAQGPPIHLRISDDGVGFDRATVPGGHLGLTIMGERADGVGATLEVTSTPDEGTTIDLTAQRT